MANNRRNPRNRRTPPRHRNPPRTQTKGAKIVAFLRAIWGDSLPRKLTISAVFLAVVPIIAGFIKPTLVQDVDQALRPETVELTVATQGYDIQTGRQGSPVGLGTKLVVETTDANDPIEIVRDTVGRWVSDSINREEMHLSATLTLSDFRLSSTRPLVLLVSELDTQNVIQVSPGAERLSTQGVDLYPYFNEGRFFNTKCSCITVALRDDTGRFDSNFDHVYFIDGKLSLLPQASTTSLDVTLDRDRITLAVIVDTPGAKAEDSERVKAMIYAALQEKFAKDTTVRISPYHTQAELDQVRDDLSKILPSAKKTDRVKEANVDELVLTTVTIKRDSIFRRWWTRR